MGKGRTDVEFDVSELSSEIDHQIAVAWSTKNGEIRLYIDGEPVKKSRIEYAS